MELIYLTEVGDKLISSRKIVSSDKKKKKQSIFFLIQTIKQIYMGKKYKIKN